MRQERGPRRDDRRSADLLPRQPADRGDRRGLHALPHHPL